MNKPVKKGLIYVSGLVIIAVIVFLSLFRGLELAKEKSIPQLVPGNAVAFVEIKEIEKIWSRAAGSPFWKALTETPLFREARVEERARAISDYFQSVAGFPLDRDNFMELCGRDAGLAFIPGLGENDPTALVLVTRVGVRTKALELISRWGEKFKAADQRFLIESEHEGVKLVEFKPSEFFPFSSAYAVKGDYLFLVVSHFRAADVLKQIIELSKGKGKASPLADDPDYRRWSQAAVLSIPSQCEFFLRLDALTALWGTEASLLNVDGPDSVIMDWKGIQERLKGRLAIFHFIGARLALGKDLEIRCCRDLDLDRVRALYGERLLPLWNVQADYYQALKFVPSGSLTFLWISAKFPLLWEKFKLDWDLFRPFLGPETVTAVEKWKDSLPVTVQTDLFPWVGEEAALVVVRLNTGTLIPLPEAALLIKVKDKDEARVGCERLLARLLAGTGVRPVKTDPAGIEITTLPLSPFFQPAYAVVGDFLVLGTGAEVLKEIRATERGESRDITSDPDFLKAASVHTPAASFLYLNSRRLAAAAEEAGNWWLRLQRAAGKAGEGEKTLEKALRSLKPWEAFRALALRDRLSREFVIRDIYWYIDSASILGDTSIPGDEDLGEKK